MSIHTYYRCAVWLPLLIPAATVFVLGYTDLRPTASMAATVVQVVVFSGIYGGMPYALLATYATWWIDERPEFEVRRKALSAPLWMILLWLVFSGLVGALYGRIETLVRLFWLGTGVILPLGYAYVGLVLLLRPLVCTEIRASVRKGLV